MTWLWHWQALWDALRLRRRGHAWNIEAEKSLRWGPAPALRLMLPWEWARQGGWRNLWTHGSQEGGRWTLTCSGASFLFFDPVWFIWLFTAALFIIARTWKQPRCPSTREWIKMWDTYTMEYYSAIKRNTSESALMRWVNLEPLYRVK